MEDSEDETDLKKGSCNCNVVIKIKPKGRWLFLRHGAVESDNFFLASQALSERHVITPAYSFLEETERGFIFKCENRFLISQCASGRYSANPAI